jgi:hypothetical protein
MVQHWPQAQARRSRCESRLVSCFSCPSPINPAPDVILPISVYVVFHHRHYPRLSDLNELISNYTPNPVLVIINANPTDDLGIPTDAYGMYPLEFSAC